jgi:uncharacterized membrane protein HdeD (DUF308 family)
MQGGIYMQYVRQYRSLFIFEGIIFTILGALAIALPSFFTLGAELFIGVLFVVAGIVQGWRTLQTKGVPGFVWSLFVALIYLLAGISLLVHPLIGILTLTVILTVFFVIDGIANIILGLQFKPYGVWAWRIASGLISLILAYLIYIDWPGSAAWLLGLLVGINLLFVGITQLVLAFSVPRTT